MKVLEFFLDLPKQYKKAGEVYGGIFVLIFLTLASVAMVLSGKESWETLASSGPWLGLIVVVLYNLGSALDPVFDTVFNPSTDYIRVKEHYIPLNPLGRKMRDARMEAARFLLKEETQKPLAREKVEGIYRRAKILYENSSGWKKEVQTPLALSKALRSLVIPVALVLGYYFFWHLLPRHKSAPNWISELNTWWSELSTDLVFWWCALVLLGCLLGYVILRVRHMRALYDLVPRTKSMDLTCDLPDSDWGTKDECEDQKLVEVSCEGFLLLIKRMQNEENRRYAPLKIRAVWRADHPHSQLLGPLLNLACNFKRNKPELTRESQTL